MLKQMAKMLLDTATSKHSSLYQSEIGREVNLPWLFDLLQKDMHQETGSIAVYNVTINQDESGHHVSVIPTQAFKC